LTYFRKIEVATCFVKQTKLREIFSDQKCGWLFTVGLYFTDSVEDRLVALIYKIGVINILCEAGGGDIPEEAVEDCPFKLFAMFAHEL